MSVITPPPHVFSAARWDGLRVGLLGGSFNPAHAGHMHIARQAIMRFKLHAVWWVVTPGNPLKVKNPTGDLEKRVVALQKFIHHPRMVATDIEAHMKTRFTFDTVRQLKIHFPRTRFVWVAGMDNACVFDRWERWEDLPKLIPFVFFDRPPASCKLKGKRLRQHKGIRQNSRVIRKPLKINENGVYWMLRGRAVNLSSTALRAAIAPRKR